MSIKTLYFRLTRKIGEILLNVKPTYTIGRTGQFYGKGFTVGYCIFIKIPVVGYFPTKHESVDFKLIKFKYRLLKAGFRLRKIDLDCEGDKENRIYRLRKKRKELTLLRLLVPYKVIDKDSNLNSLLNRNLIRVLLDVHNP